MYVLEHDFNPAGAMLKMIAGMPSAAPSAARPPAPSGGASPTTRPLPSAGISPRQAVIVAARQQYEAAVARGVAVLCDCKAWVNDSLREKKFTALTDGECLAHSLTDEVPQRRHAAT